MNSEMKPSYPERPELSLVPFIHTIRYLTLVLQSVHLDNQEAEREENWCLAHVLSLFIQSKTLSSQDAATYTQGGLPSSLKPL